MMRGHSPFVKRVHRLPWSVRVTPLGAARPSADRPRVDSSLRCTGVPTFSGTSVRGRLPLQSRWVSGSGRLRAIRGVWSVEFSQRNDPSIYRWWPRLACSPAIGRLWGRWGSRAPVSGRSSLLSRHSGVRRKWREFWKFIATTQAVRARSPHALPLPAKTAFPSRPGEAAR